MRIVLQKYNDMHDERGRFTGRLTASGYGEHVSKNPNPKKAARETAQNLAAHLSKPENRKDPLRKYGRVQIAALAHEHRLSDFDAATAATGTGYGDKVLNKKGWREGTALFGQIIKPNSTLHIPQHKAPKEAFLTEKHIANVTKPGDTLKNWERVQFFNGTVKQHNALHDKQRASYTYFTHLSVVGHDMKDKNAAGYVEHFWKKFNDIKAAFKLPPGHNADHIVPKSFFFIKNKRTGDLVNSKLNIKVMPDALNKSKGQNVIDKKGKLWFTNIHPELYDHMTVEALTYLKSLENHPKGKAQLKANGGTFAKGHPITDKMIAKAAKEGRERSPFNTLFGKGKWRAPKGFKCLS